MLRRNIKTTRLSSKLDYKKLGAFLIKRVVRSVNYELKLPKEMKIYPIFHVSLLEPAPPDAETIVPDLSKENEGQEYEVEKVVDWQDTEEKGREYLIKWKNYGEIDNTWEPVAELSHAKAAVRQFHRENPEVPAAGNQKEPRAQGSIAPRRKVLRPGLRPRTAER